jgi:hypothetical protein
LLFRPPSADSSGCASLERKASLPHSHSVTRHTSEVHVAFGMNVCGVHKMPSPERRAGCHARGGAVGVAKGGQLSVFRRFGLLCLLDPLCVAATDTLHLQLPIMQVM